METSDITEDDQGRVTVRVNDKDVVLSRDQSAAIKNIILEENMEGEMMNDNKQQMDIEKNPTPSKPVTRSSSKGNAVDDSPVKKRMRISRDIIALDHFDYNHYATKKTVAQALLLLALAAACACILKAVLQVKHDNQFYGFLATFTVLAILLLFVIAALLLIVGRSNINTENRERLSRINVFNDVATGFILLLCILIIIVCSFGLINAPLERAVKQYFLQTNGSTTQVAK